MWSCVGDFLTQFSVFERKKVTFIENISFTDNAFGNRLLDCSKLAVNGKNNNDVAIYQHDVMVKFFWRYFVCLVNFSYWSKFHVNIITGSGVRVIFLWPEIRKLEITLSEFCPISGDWGKLGIRNLTWMLVMKGCWMLQIAKSYSFDCFWVIKVKPTSRVSKMHKVSMNQMVSTIRYKNY